MNDVLAIFTVIKIAMRQNNSDEMRNFLENLGIL
jgi:hypothetical protein